MTGVEIRPGQRLRAESGVEVIVIHAGTGVVGSVECGGRALVDAAAKPAPPPEPEGETLLGKRYVDEETGIELLCTKGGVGALAVDGRPLRLKEAKPLPASDWT